MLNFDIRVRINDYIFDTKQILSAFTGAFAFYVAYLLSRKSTRDRFLKKLLAVLKSAPGVKGVVEKEKAKYLEKMKSMVPSDSESAANAVIPLKSRSAEEIISDMTKRKQKDCDWKHGKAWGFVYHGSDEHSELMNKAYSMFAHANPLHTSAFPSIQRMEAEVVHMTRHMLHGDDKVIGTMTSGGSESLLLAIKTYRDKARKERGITEPEVVLPQSAHAAFAKAGQYFNVKMIWVPVRADGRADVDAMRKAITGNTICLVGSTPSYPHGVIDPIEELGALALKYGIGLHVDGCLGGFMLPWVKKLGYSLPPFDFAVNGVTSMSADVHKYGYAAKGCSVILYRNEEYLLYQFSTYADWTGGLYGSPTVAGSRPGGIIATAWASLQEMGEEGFMNIMDQVMKTSLALQRGVNAIAGVNVVGKPDASVFAIESKELDIFKIGEALAARGWHLEKQQFPNSLHLTVTLRHVPIVDQFLRDLSDSVEEVRTQPEKFADGAAPIYGMAARMPDRELVEDLVARFLASLYK